MRQVCGYLSSKRASFVKFCSDAPENPMVRLAIYGKAVQSRGFFRKKPGVKKPVVSFFRITVFLVNLAAYYEGKFRETRN